jgi:hypothetical protein
MPCAAVSIAQRLKSAAARADCCRKVIGRAAAPVTGVEVLTVLALSQAAPSK